MGWIDVSGTVPHGMPHWPGNPMVCLPVKLHGSDGPPARVMLRPIGPHQASSAEVAP
jgi:kynurenine formamidase